METTKPQHTPFFGPKPARLLIISISAYLALLALALFCVSQYLSFDPSLCIKMADNAAKNICFNCYVHPNVANLNNDISDYITWWTPAQYAIPLLFKMLLGTNLGVSIKLTILVCLISFTLGMFKLCQLLLVPGKATVISPKGIVNIDALFVVFIIICQPLFWENITSYDGGGILQMAFCPWFIYLVFKIKKLSPVNLLMILLAALFGFFLKASFTSVFAGALLFLFIGHTVVATENRLQIKNAKTFWANALSLASLFISYIIVIKYGFLNRNFNISDSAAGIRLQPRVVIFPLVAPILNLWPGAVLERTYQWLILTPFVAALYYYLVFQKKINTRYKFLVAGFLIAYLGFFVVLYIMNVEISYEARHFKIFAIILAPAILVQTRQSGNKYFIYVGLCMISLIMLGNYVRRYYKEFHGLKIHYTENGLTTIYPSKIINKMHQLDDIKGRSKDIFYIQGFDPAMALEIKHNRVLIEGSLITYNFKSASGYADTVYFGKNSGNLYVVFPQNNFKQDSLKFLTKFEKYKQFKLMYEADKYGIYLGIPNKN